MKRHALALAAVALLSALLAACGSSGSSAADSHAFERRNADRLVYSRYSTEPATTSRVPEAAAIDMMIDHHQDAIDAATKYLPHASTGELADFAARIIRVQGDQVGQLKSWRSAWYPDHVPPASSWSPMFCTISSVSSDAGFLTTMVIHHDAAIAMYRDWAANGSIDHLDFGLLLKSVGKGQIGEVAWMRSVLAGGVDDDHGDVVASTVP